MSLQLPPELGGDVISDSEWGFEEPVENEDPETLTDQLENEEVDANAGA